MQARAIDFAPCSDFFLDTLETFRSQGRGDLSFTDAAIVTAARRYPPGCVATFDSDFRGLDGVTVVPSPQPAPTIRRTGSRGGAAKVP